MCFEPEYTIVLATAPSWRIQHKRMNSRRYFVFPPVSIKLKNALIHEAILKVFAPCSIKACSCPHFRTTDTSPAAILWGTWGREREKLRMIKVENQS